MMMPFGGVTLYYFSGCACFNVFHLKLLKNIHNFFAYYIKYNLGKIFFKKAISFHFIRLEIQVYLSKQM
jgi:hypothetical protein